MSQARIELPWAEFKQFIILRRFDSPIFVLPALQLDSYLTSFSSSVYNLATKKTLIDVYANLLSFFSYALQVTETGVEVLTARLPSSPDVYPWLKPSSATSK
jgi:hypothetical protein